MFSDFPNHMVWNFVYVKDHTALCTHRQKLLGQYKPNTGLKLKETIQALKYDDEDESLARKLMGHLESCKNLVFGTPISQFYKEFSDAVKIIYQMIYTAKAMRRTSGSSKSGDEEIRRTFAHIQFPVGCLFPSLDQLKVRLPEENLRSYNPLPYSPYYIKSRAPVAVKVFSSKDVPCCLTFELDGEQPSTRSIIFKVLTNSLPETLTSSFLENTFFCDDHGRIPSIDQGFDLMYPNVHGSLPMYRVTPLLIDLVAVEVLEDCIPLKDFKEVKEPNEQNGAAAPVPNSAEPKGLRKILGSNWNQHFSKLNLKDYANLIVNTTVSHAFCSSMHLALGLGDRNFSNIMIQKHQKLLVNIDFELILGTGQNLPVPEIAPLRMGPFFQLITGSMLTKGLFCSVMTIYTRKILDERLSSMPPHFLEVCAHKGQKFFMTLDEDRVSKFFEMLLDNMNGNAANLVDQAIVSSNDPSIAQKMYIGMEPAL